MFQHSKTINLNHLKFQFISFFFFFDNVKATISENGDKMTYKEYYEHCIRMAILIQDSGLKKGDRVGIIGKKKKK